MEMGKCLMCNKEKQLVDRSDYCEDCYEVLRKRVHDAADKTRSVDYSQKKYWTVDLLEETLNYHTVLKPHEKGNFNLLWQAKLDCEKLMGHVMRPAFKTHIVKE